MRRELTVVARIYTQGRYRRASVQPGHGEALVLKSDADAEIDRLRAALQAQQGDDRKVYDLCNTLDGFMSGVIAALGALAPHSKHGDVVHDEIVASVGKEALYAAAEPEDVEWAGLDPDFYAALAARREG